MGNVQGVLGATRWGRSEGLHVASLVRPADVAVEALQHAEQDRLAMVPGNWRSQKQSRLTMTLAARLGHHLTVMQTEADWTDEVTGSVCRVSAWRRSRLRNTAVTGRTAGPGAKAGYGLCRMLICLF